jgi:hypothetical protein
MQLIPDATKTAILQPYIGVGKGMIPSSDRSKVDAHNGWLAWGPTTFAVRSAAGARQRAMEKAHGKETTMNFMFLLLCINV